MDAAKANEAIQSLLHGGTVEMDNGASIPVRHLDFVRFPANDDAPKIIFFEQGRENLHRRY